MSATDGPVDDADEVTLWAGRLRAWPARPLPDDDLDDDTVIARREASVDDTVRSAADVPDDETVVSRPSVPAGATGRPVSDEPDDETIISRPQAPESARSAPDLPEDETVVSRPQAPADDTARSARRRPVPPGDEATPAPTPEVDDVTRRRPADVDPDDDTRVRPAALDDETRVRSTGDAPDDDTAAGSRRSRREGAAQAASAPLVPGGVREAHVPEALGRETYAPRSEGPIRVDRSAPARAVPREDAAAVRPRARRGAVRVVVLVAVMVVILVGAAVGAVVLLTS